MITICNVYLSISANLRAPYSRNPSSESSFLNPQSSILNPQSSSPIRGRMVKRSPLHCCSLFLIIFLLCLISASNRCGAIWLSLPSSGTKCVSEEIQNNVVVLADYYIISEDHSAHEPAVSIKVTSPYGNNLHHRENVTHGQFAFTTSEAGNYLACFWLDGAPKGADVSVNLDWRTGIAAKDWESVAKKEKIEGVELELRKLEGAVEAIHENLIYLKSREAEMRVVSETTNARVALFSLFSLSVCIIVSVLQVVYLKQYFRKKKLI